MLNQTETKVFETGDARLTAYLFCLQFKLAKPPYLKGPVVIFPFIYSPEIEIEVENFKKKTTHDVGLTRFASKLAHVKALVHNYRKLEAGDSIGGEQDE
jgi:hypothetical protein